MIRVPILAAMLAALACPAGAGERMAIMPQGAAAACARYGQGFVEVPGTSTCIRIGGRVRSEFGTASRKVAREDVAGFRTSGSVSLDARTDTGYGPLRTYVRVRAGQGSGAR